MSIEEIDELFDALLRSDGTGGGAGLPLVDVGVFLYALSNCHRADINFVDTAQA